MSTRIIIEKDGERYAPVDLFEHWFADDMTSMGMSNDDGEIEFDIKPLPPVIRTDNSEVIANHEAENAKIAKCLEEFMLAAEMVLPVDVLEQYNRAKLVKRCRKALKEAKKIGGEE